MKPTLLFVDDRSKRIHTALKNYSDKFDVTIAPNVFEALRLMSGCSWDVVDLDHDLNGCDFEDPDSKTSGMEIVRYIEKTGWPDTKSKPVFWVHSSNLFGTHLISKHLIAMGFEVYHRPLKYDPVERLKYDEQGNPTNRIRT